MNAHILIFIKGPMLLPLNSHLTNKMILIGEKIQISN